MFILLIFGTMEAGWFFSQQVEIRNVARKRATVVICMEPGTDPDPIVVNDDAVCVTVSKTRASLNWTPRPNPDPHFSSFTDDVGDPVAFEPVDGNRTNCVWRGSANTAFARVIGIDTINVDASAIARRGVTGDAAILPFLLPPGATTHTCLGSPPAGLSRAPCSGGTSGNCGYIAMGIDHPITIEPKWPTDPSTADDDFLDECVGGTPPGYVPNSLDIVQGVAFDASLQDGMVSNSTFGAHNTPSRLQQSPPSGLTPVMAQTRSIQTSNGSIVETLDNIGLWEYISSGTGLCNPDTEPMKTLWGNNPGALPEDEGGPAATDALLDCLNAVDVLEPP